MQPNEPSVINPFGEPLDLELLLNFAEVDSVDAESAIEWFDRHASEMFVGVLDNEPIGKRK